jgi:hypothetical protein
MRRLRGSLGEEWLPVGSFGTGTSRHATYAHHIMVTVHVMSHSSPARHCAHAMRETTTPRHSPDRPHYTPPQRSQLRSKLDIFFCEKTEKQCTHPTAIQTSPVFALAGY